MEEGELTNKRNSLNSGETLSSTRVGLSLSYSSPRKHHQNTPQLLHLTLYTLIMVKVRTLHRRTKLPIADPALPHLSLSRHVHPRTQILMILYDGGEHAVQQPKLLGTTENSLGLAPYCKAQGWELVVTSSKEGADSQFQKHIVDSE